MNIQTGYGVSAYQNAGKVGSQQMGAPSSKPAPVASYAGSPFSSSSDQVTISAAARDLVANDGSATQARTLIQQRLLNSAASDRQDAEKLASDMANTPSTIFFDIRGLGGGDPINRLSSGRIVDETFKQKFSSEASVIDAQRKAIYSVEKAKGTDPVQILSKMFDFTNAQSRDYLEASGWLA